MSRKWLVQVHAQKICIELKTEGRKERKEEKNKTGRQGTVVIYKTFRHK